MGERRGIGMRIAVGREAIRIRAAQPGGPLRSSPSRGSGCPLPQQWKSPLVVSCLCVDLFQSGMSLSVRQRRACDHTQAQYLLWFRLRPLAGRIAGRASAMSASALRDAATTPCCDPPHGDGSGSSGPYSPRTLRTTKSPPGVTGSHHFLRELDPKQAKRMSEIGELLETRRLDVIGNNAKFTRPLDVARFPR